MWGMLSGSRVLRWMAVAVVTVQLADVATTAIALSMGGTEVGVAGSSVGLSWYVVKLAASLFGVLWLLGCVDLGRIRGEVAAAVLALVLVASAWAPLMNLVVAAGLH